MPGVGVMSQNRSGVALCASLGLAASLVALTLPSMALAQQAGGATTQPKPHRPKPMVSRAHAASPNAMVNLVNLLVEQHVIKQDAADIVIRQAEDEAYIAQQAAKDATVKAGQAAHAATIAAAAASPPGSKHVTYVPEIVKRQLRDELRREVFAQAQRENWASPGLYPAWASRIHFYGDLRTRFQGNFFPRGGANAPGLTTNFNAINTGSPYDVSSLNPVAAPAYNNTTNGQAFEIEARLGAVVDIVDGLSANIRIATGDSNSPVSTNQTLGGDGGNFSKYAAWLDRAALLYAPNPNFAFSLGRFDNPFFTATDLVWYRDLAFDGAAIQARHEVRPGVEPFIVAGAFPVFNTALNVGTTQDTQVPNENSYLFGGQVGLRWHVASHTDLTFAAAYFDFTNVQARLSDPCDVTLVASCSTDDLRPAFAQKGNTYTFLRDIVPPAGSIPGEPFSEPQYFGLASQFRPLDISARADLSNFDPIHIVADGEFVYNTGFDRAQVAATAVNNLAGTPDGSVGPFNGGNLGWMGRLTVGEPEMLKFGDWNASVGYKYLQSDATIDAFTDPDFGLGGTNLKGYVLAGRFAWATNVWTTLRWLSATQIAGAPYAVDVLQLDLNTRF
jgi:hypothetical protein